MLPAWSWWWARLGPVSGTWQAYWKGLDPLTPQVTLFPGPSLGEPGRRPPQALTKDTEDARPQSEAPQWAGGLAVAAWDPAPRQVPQAEAGGAGSGRSGVLRTRVSIWT